MMSCLSSVYKADCYGEKKLGNYKKFLSDYTKVIISITILGCVGESLKTNIQGHNCRYF